MKIIDVICEIPGLNIEGKKEKLNEGYTFSQYIAENELYAADWATKICNNILAKNNINKDEIGVIINNCTIPSNTLKSRKNSWSPSLSHVIQKEINTPNSFVFDIYFQDWGKIIDITDSFLSNSAYKYGLIINLDLISNCIINNNGFTITDGISVLLIEYEKDSENITNTSYYIDSNILTPAQINYVLNDDINNEYIKFSVNWKYNDTVIDILSKELDQIIENNYDNKRLIVENWSPKIKTKHKDKIYGKNDLMLGKFTIPWILQDLFKSGKENIFPLKFISYNPFSSYYSVLKIYKS